MKPKAKNAEWDDTAEEVEWQESTWETEEYEASKGKKGKVKRSKKGTPRSITPRPSQSQPARSDRPQPKAKPDTRSCMTSDFLFAMMSTKSKPTWRHSNWNSTDYMICTVAEPQGSCQSSSPASGHCFQTVESPSMDMMPREEFHTALRHGRAVYHGSEKCGFL